ncbi:MAG TPA: hypothetical protein VFY04_00615 [Solirubrobacterales bacterium]|nr:hypothetical protein [Solirubrobacterales bacterium]
MKLRRATLTAALSLAAIFLFAPSAANAELWWFDHREGRFPTSALPKDVKPSLLPLLITDKNGEEIKECKLEVAGKIHSNYLGMGEGSLTQAEGNPATCQTGIKECTVTAEALGTPWGLTLVEKGEIAKVQVSNFKLTLKLAGKCVGTSLPAELTLSGTIEGTFASWDGTDPARITFSETPVGSEATFNGFIGFGTELTALQEPKGFTATSTPAKLDGVQVAPFIFARGGRPSECEEAGLTGAAENGSTTIKLAPTLGKCSTTFFGTSYPTTVKANGCEYLLHLEAKEEEGEWRHWAPSDITCPTGKEVEVEVFASHADHTGGTATCRYNVGPTGNQGLENVELTNEAVTAPPETSWMKAHLDIEGISSKRTLGSFLICGAELDAAATLKGTYKLTGTTEKEEMENGIAVHPG